MNAKDLVRYLLAGAGATLLGCVDEARADRSGDPVDLHEAGTVGARPLEDASTSDSAQRRGPREGGMEEKERPIARNVWLGSDMACARVETSTSATTKCWGDNQYGQLARREVSPPGSTFTPQPILSEYAADIAVIRNLTDATGSRTCAILTDMSLKCWGSSWEYFGPIQSAIPDESILTGVEDVRMGTRFICARRENSHVACWGGNESGQLGIGIRDATIHKVPTEIPNFLADEIAASLDFACGRRGSDVWCWGGFGRNSFGTSPKSFSPGSEVRQIVGGGSMVCALVADKTVWCWTSTGALQHIADPSPDAPERLLQDVEELLMGPNGHALCARTGSGSTRCLSPAIGFDPPVASFEHVEDATHMSIGNNHKCVVTPDGFVGCVGDNQLGQLGADPMTMSATAELLFAVPF